MGTRWGDAAPGCVVIQVACVNMLLLCEHVLGYMGVRALLGENMKEGGSMGKGQGVGPAVAVAIFFPFFPFWGSV